MKRILIILINIIFINMIASTSNRENIASIISIFISICYGILLVFFILPNYRFYILALQCIPSKSTDRE